MPVELAVEEVTTAKTDAPVVDETEKTTTSPEDVKDDSTKESIETTKETVKEATDEYFDDIETLEESDERFKHGKYALKVGDATYYGSTKKETIQNLIKGKVEQDTYIRKVKAEQKVKVPTANKEEIAVAVELPNERDLLEKHLASVTKQNRIDSAMLQWGREDWNKYQDDNQLRDYEISELRQTVRETIAKANELTANDMRIANIAFVNNSILDEETQAVREMLVVSGIDQDKFDYEKVLEVAMKKIGKNGVIQSGAVTSEATKEILRIMKQSTPVKKDLTKEIEKGKTAKEALKSPPSAKKVEDKDNGKPKSFDEITREVKKSLGRSGRDI